VFLCQIRARVCVCCNSIATFDSEFARNICSPFLLVAPPPQKGIRIYSTYTYTPLKQPVNTNKFNEFFVLSSLSYLVIKTQVKSELQGRYQETIQNPHTLEQKSKASLSRTHTRTTTTTTITNTTTEQRQRERESGK